MLQAESRAGVLTRLKNVLTFPNRFLNKGAPQNTIPKPIEEIRERLATETKIKAGALSLEEITTIPELKNVGSETALEMIPIIQKAHQEVYDSLKLGQEFHEVQTPKDSVYFFRIITHTLKGDPVYCARVDQVMLRKELQEVRTKENRTKSAEAAILEKLGVAKDQELTYLHQREENAELLLLDAFISEKPLLKKIHLNLVAKLAQDAEKMVEMQKSWVDTGFNKPMLYELEQRRIKLVTTILLWVVRKAFVEFRTNLTSPVSTP